MIKQELQKHANKDKAAILQRFFKTGPGEYGQGDVFLGITVPVQRKIAKENINASFEIIQELLNNNIHEYRLTALLILTYKYEKFPNLQKQIFDFYLKNRKNINNWDLVDVTAPNIIGKFLLDKDRKILHDLIEGNLWEKRIAILSTFTFIRNKDYSDTIIFCEKLLNHPHDLIHKATGWMLREVGKRDKKVLTQFLDNYSKIMPRTMLRYSIEKLTDEERKYYLHA